MATKEQIYQALISANKNFEKVDMDTALKAASKMNKSWGEAVAQSEDFATPQQEIGPGLGAGKATAIRGRSASEQFGAGLPMAGAMAGGVVGALSPVPGGAYMGAGLGAAAGEAARSIFGGAAALPEERAKEMLGQAEIGALSEYAGAKAISPAMAQTSVYASKAKDNILKLAEKYNVPLSIAEAKQSRMWSAVEVAFDNIFTSAPTIDSFKKEQANAVKEIANRVSKQLGTTVPRDQIGVVIQESLKEGSRAAREADNVLYNTVREVIDTSQPVDLNKARLTVRQILNEQKSLPPSFQNKDLIKKANEILTGDYSFESVSALRSELGNLIDSEMTIGASKGGSGLAYNMSPLGKKYTQMKMSLEEPLDDFVKGQNEDAWALLKVAKEDWKKNTKIFNAPAVKKAIISNPEIVTQNIIKPNRVTEIRQIKSAIGNKGFQPIRERFAQDMVENMVAIDASGKQTINPKVLKATLDKYGKETVREIYGKEAADELYEIAAVTSRINDANRMFGNSSGTARVSSVIATMPGIMASPTVTGASLLSSAVLAKMYTSKLGRQLILDGIKINPATELGARELARHSVRVANFLYMNKLVDKKQRDDIIGATK